jgi:nickel/cobalt transporter (NiCoT) family protein
MPRFLTALAPDERRRLLLMLAAIAGLHVLGFALLLFGRAGAFPIGVGLTAYTLGIRHAFDADHVAAIDNTTRKLMGDGQKPVGAGFAFALGHSSVVLLLTLALGLGIKALAGEVTDGGSSLHAVTGTIGTTVSGTFLYVIAAINLVALVGFAKGFVALRRGRIAEAELEDRILAGGIMGRLLRRATGAIKGTWQLYPLGFLFGLGFDTATEIALLVLAAGAVGAGLPLTSILCLPLLFAAGMVLFDTLDGLFMRFAYGWAFARPVRKIYYNMTVTALSVVMALTIGTVELFGLDAVDLNLVGFGIVGLFALTWAVALAIWRVGRIEERLTPTPTPSL